MEYDKADFIQNYVKMLQYFRKFKMWLLGQN